MPTVLITTKRKCTENPKRFWSYVKYTWGKTQTIPSLRDSNGDPKAEFLNIAFRNSFTKEDETNIPDFELRTEGIMSNVEVDIIGVVQQLKSLFKSLFKYYE